MEKRRRKKYVKVRMDDKLYKALQEQAKRNKRPMTRQVEFYIDEAIRKETAEAPPVDRAADGTAASEP